MIIVIQHKSLVVSGAPYREPHCLFLLAYEGVSWHLLSYFEAHFTLKHSTVINVNIKGIMSYFGEA
jgi:hypothetical protein